MLTGSLAVRERDAFRLRVAGPGGGSRRPEGRGPGGHVGAVGSHQLVAGGGHGRAGGRVALRARRSARVAARSAGAAVRRRRGTAEHRRLAGDRVHLRHAR